MIFKSIDSGLLGWELYCVQECLRPPAAFNVSFKADLFSFPVQLGITILCGMFWAKRFGLGISVKCLLCCHQ